MLKFIINKCIESYLKQKVRILEKELASENEGTTIQDANDADDESHRYQTLVQKEETSKRIIKVMRDLEELKSIPLEKSAQVQKGALIELEDLFLYVGITTDQFNEFGRQIMGISTEAPIYKKMIGKTVGSSIDVNNKKYTILSIK
ncbi:hypothetical protein KMW28_23095 [Flammeovirga yaeyamensis]|uniref:Transcription elongation factor n=1 Tax=Flammeovirga yaeyamensis TaxID=367791 RepID=A0AAX1NCR2_9BACT|nr:hypothetical protein [Flammeovirga yaeyamensis]MBB3696746.1 transcription elongation GreA/GreB family factor [Flammeovirga yaeyamensis]NMF33414.1 hypothetical protein [Flammeovirga yaeyamensis]QWG05311.1 hypothetical protein KMW28_23095 [Flammeovirga yaeyamensis]